MLNSERRAGVGVVSGWTKHIVKLHRSSDFVGGRCCKELIFQVHSLVLQQMFNCQGECTTILLPAQGCDWKKKKKSGKIFIPSHVQRIAYPTSSALSCCSSAFFCCVYSTPPSYLILQRREQMQNLMEISKEPI